MRALVAMSGGVDSSVAAALMVERGHEVVGVTLKQWEEPGGGLPTSGCCTLSDAEDARRAAAVLDIPYYVLDHVAEFRREVVDRFGAMYQAGLTPNPCIECNRRVRFKTLLERTARLGCDLLVTGHHARVERRRNGYHLRRAVDRSKDQSYVLHMLGQRELAALRLPVGEMTKDAVRAHAARLGLRTATKPDSQDLCFVGDGDYRQFLRREFPDSARPGDIVDEHGAAVGRHDGAVDFTIGQRRGLGIAAPEPRYVTAIDPSTSTVTIGPKADLEVGACVIVDVTFVGGAPPPSGGLEVQLRYRSGTVPCRITELGGGSWRIELDRPARAVAPGQAAVLYRGDEVIGGGTIETTAGE